MVDWAMLDVFFCRSHFPALASPWALLDNAGGSVTPRQVIERVTEYMSRYQVQLGASYALSAMAGELVEQGRVAAAALVGAAPDEIVLGPSTTMNVLVLAQALAPLFAPGDEIVVTDLDHESNSGAWRRLAERGLVIKEWQLRRDTAALELADLESLLTARTRLVCFTHCSNIVGGFHDVAAITRRVHEAGAMVCVDGVAYAPHRRVDVRALDVDFYLTSLYKTYGPHLGLLYGKREHLLAARGVNHFFIGEDDVPYKLQPGSVVHELAAGVPGILGYLDAVYEHHFGAADIDRAVRLERVFALFAEHEEALASRLIDFLRSHEHVRVLGPQSGDQRRRAPTVAFVVHGQGAGELPIAMDRAGVAIRYGHFYAHRAISALGLHERGGVVRASMVHYNTPDEIERLISALEPILVGHHVTP